MVKHPENILNFLIDFLYLDSVVILKPNLELSENISKLLNEKFLQFTSNSDKFKKFTSKSINEQKPEIHTIWGFLKCLDLLNCSSDGIQKVVESIFQTLHDNINDVDKCK
jgi:hypothetical protein